MYCRCGLPYDTVGGIGSVSFEQRRKSGKLKLFLRQSVFTPRIKWKFTCDVWSEPFRLPCNFIELSFVSKRNRDRKSKP